ncbi:MAG: mechanosensitive ion channel family protein [Planctomycetota bacterium]|nr:MAG: mechanosensitive ion channel family protein [Planctomycetota bacterium]
MFGRILTSVVALLFLLDGSTVAQEQVSLDLASESRSAPVTIADPQVPLDDLRIMVKPLTKAELEVEADAWFQLLRAKAAQVAVLRLGVKKASDAATATEESAAESLLEEVEQAKEIAQRTAEQTEEEVTEAAQERIGTEPTIADEDAEAETPADADSDDGTADETEAAVTDTASEVKTDLLTDINQLQDERTALSDRLKIVLDSLAEKGGDVEEYRKYAAAVTTVELETSDLESAWSGFVGWLTSKEGGQRWAWNLVKFLVVLFVSYVIARVLASIVKWLLERKIRLTQLAENLIANVIKYVLLLIGFAVALTALEVDITPILAAMGATGLVVGLALQDSLSNVASGVMILLNRPFDVGDIVTAGGVTGTVRQMNLVSTNFRTFDNQTIHVPNNEIWNNVITNVTANPVRRVDLEFGVGYGDDFEQAEQIIRDAVQQHDLVLAAPEPEVVTHALADSSVNIVCRPWSKTSDWWQVKTDITREVKRRLDAAGISIPYPQHEVHVHHNGAPA